MVRNFKDQFSLHFSRPSTYLIPKAGCYYCYISKVLPKLLQRVNAYMYHNLQKYLEPLHVSTLQQ